MKKIIALCLALASLNAGATIYYINSATGSSGNNGTSDTTPKSNCSQVPEVAGDTVLWARGTEHSGSCTLVDGTSDTVRTIYGAYGSGTPPVLKHSGNVFVKNDAANIIVRDLVLNPTTQGGSDAGLRTDRAHHVRVENVEFIGGYDGWRIDAVSGGTSTYNLEIYNSSAHGQANNGIRWVIGATSGTADYTGYNVTIDGLELYDIQKEPFYMSQQGACMDNTNCDGIAGNEADGRMHKWYNVDVNNLYVHDSMLITPTVAGVNDDQCIHVRNLRNTTLGESVWSNIRIKNCGRTSGDSSLLTGLWLEGAVNLIVRDFEFDGVYTPGNDGGALFLDATASDGTGFNSTGNFFERGFIKNVAGNRGCVPITATQCNNSDGISVTRASSGNVFNSIIITDTVIGLHVTGNAGVNSYYGIVAFGNEYGAYIQTNSADTPAGLAQVIRNSIFYGNDTRDYQYTTSFPKADEQFNLIGTITNSTPHASDLSADPKFIGGVVPSTPLDFRLNARSPAIGAGACYLSGTCAYKDFLNRRHRRPPNIGAFASGFGDQR